MRSPQIWRPKSLFSISSGVHATYQALRGQACVERGSADDAFTAELFQKGRLVEGDLERFYVYNLEFHDILVDASKNQAIAIALSRNNRLPFGSVAALALDWEDVASEYQHLLAAHQQHRAVSEAILCGKADEAEHLMRQHAHAPLLSKHQTRTK